MVFDSRHDDGWLFGEADLRPVAGEKSFGRGLGYLDAVGDLEIGVDQVTATVYGTDAYEVVLDLDDGAVSGDCSCPHGQEGFFCKHLVAVGLTALRQAGDVPAQRAAAAAKARSLESWLDGVVPVMSCSRRCAIRSARTGARAGAWSYELLPLGRT